MDEVTISEFKEALSSWVWGHGFIHFCEATGFTGQYAEAKWFQLKAANDALGAFHAATLAKILASK